MFQLKNAEAFDAKWYDISHISQNCGIINIYTYHITVVGIFLLCSELMAWSVQNYKGKASIRWKIFVGKITKGLYMVGGIL